MTLAAIKKNPHITLAVTGVAVGFLTLLQTYFHTGSIPTSAQVAGVLSGAGISAASIFAGILAHLGITKAQVTGADTAVVAAIPKVEQVLTSVPGLSARIDGFEQAVDAKVAAGLAALPKPLAADLDQLAELVRQKIVAAAVPAPTA